MTSYSRHKFLRDWRYAVDRDFTTATGDPFPYATPNGRQTWGDEVGKITFGDGSSGDDEDNNKSTPHDGCVSDDGRFLAIATASDIHIIDTTTLDTIVILQGHVSRISSLAFRPDDSNTLVSSEEGDHGRVERPVKPTIYVWDVLREAKRPQDVADDEVLRQISRVAARAAADRYTKLMGGEELGEAEVDELEREMVSPIGRIARKHAAAAKCHLHGRLATSFQSNVFSPSGDWMVYLPGDRPRFNGSDHGWVMSICSTNGYAVKHTLHGHTDAIIWTGWSPDESLFASVSWDKTVRVWDPATASQMHQFETDRQNRAAAFSRDSRLLAFTTGDGTIAIHDLANDGACKWSVKLDDSSHWKRALDWHPDGKTLAVGGGQRGELLLLDTEEQRVLQRRLTSADACTPDKDSLRRVLNNWVGTREVCFSADGTLLITWLGGDCSVEVYDLEKAVKWRFARGGVDDGPRSHEWRDDEGNVTSKTGWGMLFWQAGGRTRLASLDFDGVRVWSMG